MDYFLEFLDRFWGENPLLIEAIAAGYKICHPEYLDSISLEHGLVYGDARDLSQNTVPTTTLASIGTSLRNPSPETGSLTRISNGGRINIVYENATGKEEIDVDTLIQNIDNAIQGLSEGNGDRYINELIQIFRSQHESRRGNALISLLNYAITGSKKQSFADSKYVYETEHKVILCSIRLSNHYSSNKVISKEEAKLNIHPKNRLSLVSPDWTKTKKVANEGGNAQQEFDSSNPITKTEIVVNPAYLKLGKTEPGVRIRNILKVILQNLKEIFSSEVQNQGMMGEVALHLSSSLQKVVDVYQIDESGKSFKNGKELKDNTEEK